MKKYVWFGLFTWLICLGASALQGSDDPPPFSDISPAQLMDMIQSSAGAIQVKLLDVRTPAEIAEGYIEGALSLNINTPDFGDRVAELDKKGVYVVYCRSGKRSARAMARMKELGFVRVYNLSGGMMRWQSEKRPVEVPSKAPSEG